MKKYDFLSNIRTHLDLLPIAKLVFFIKYDHICSGILEYSMYEWDAMPILSVLSNK